MSRANHTTTTKRRRLPNRPGEHDIFYAGPLGPNGEVPPLPDGAQLLVGRKLPANVVRFPTAARRAAARAARQADVQASLRQKIGTLLADLGWGDVS